MGVIYSIATEVHGRSWTD